MISTSVNDFFNARYLSNQEKIVLDDSMDDFIVDDNKSVSSNEEESDLDDYNPKRTYSFRPGQEDEPVLKKRKFTKSNTYSKFLDELDDEYSEKSTRKKKSTLSYFSEFQLGQQKIIGREKEAKQIIAMLEQPLGGVRPLLLGCPGIGKQSVVAKVSALYKQEFHDFSFHGRQVFCISCQDLISDSIEEFYGEVIIDAIKELFKKHLLEKKQEPVFYFRDIEALMLMPDVVDYMHTCFKQPNSFIASIGQEASDEKIQGVIKMLSQHNFVPFPIKEAPLNDVCEIVQNHLLQHADKNKIHYMEDGVELAVRLSGKHITTRPFPIKAINAIYECGVEVMLKTPFEKKQVEVSSLEVAKFFSSKTNIPFEDLLDESVFNEERFVEKLKKNIVGQDYAIKIVAERAATWKMGLLNPNKPWGSFLFIGPTGVGKTELAKQLAKQLFRSEADILIFDGSEYKESHTASNLIGAPRGYEGHDLGGMLTGPLLENPYRIILFDEFEKAHDEVRKIFLPAFDQGRLTDRRGRVVDCSKALFVMTSNLGSSENFNVSKAKTNTHEKIVESLKPTLVQHLSAEMCGRFTAIVPFMPITKPQLYELAEVELRRIEGHLLKQAEIELYWTAELLTKFASMDVDLRFGGRQFCGKVNDIVTAAIKNMITSQQKRIKGKIMLDVSPSNQLTVELMK